MTDAAKVVELAIASAGQMNKGWQRRVFESTAEIAAMLRKGSKAVEWAERILSDDVAVFAATFIGFEEEIPQGMNRATRLIVHTQSDEAIIEKPGPRQNLTGEEHIRTDPLWTRSGRIVADRIRELPIGSEIRIYKLTESVDGDRKSRVMLHFEVLRSPSTGAQPPRQSTPAASSPVEAHERQDEPQQPPQVAPDQAPESGSPPSQIPEPHSAGDNAALSQIEQLYGRLTARQCVAYSHACKSVGIKNPMAPEPEDLEKAFEFLKSISGGG